MSGRERTGADFYPPPSGFRSQGRPGGAPRAQNPGRQRGRKKIDPFLTLLGGVPKGRPEGVSAHPLTGADFYPPPGGFRSPFRSPYC